MNINKKSLKFGFALAITIVEIIVMCGLAIYGYTDYNSIDELGMSALVFIFLCVLVATAVQVGFHTMPAYIDYKNKDE